MATSSRTCKTCRALLPLDRFGRNKGKARASCRSCEAAITAAWRRTHYFDYVYQQAKQRAVRDGLDFDLTAAYLCSLWVNECPITGVVLEQSGERSPWHIGRSVPPNRAALDRINPARGYVRGNVAFISTLANRIKSNGTAALHRRIADWMEGRLAKPYTAEQIRGAAAAMIWGPAAEDVKTGLAAALSGY